MHWSSLGRRLFTHPTPECTYLHTRDFFTQVRRLTASCYPQRSPDHSEHFSKHAFSSGTHCPDPSPTYIPNHPLDTSPGGPTAISRTGFHSLIKFCLATCIVGQEPLVLGSEETTDTKQTWSRPYWGDRDESNKQQVGTSLVIQRLGLSTSPAGDTSSVPGQETKILQAV